MEALDMSNIFDNNSHCNFSWSTLGDIAAGRPHLGTDLPVAVYRIFEYAMFDVLTHKFGLEEGQKLFREAGHKAGSEFAKNVLDLTLESNAFLAQLAEKLSALKIGILRIEKFDKNNGNFILTVGEDLDCSGLPATGELVCNYDEGFLAGIMETYSKEKYEVKEIDCWSSGAKTCRFTGKTLK
jgi:predicted hydrocarbon binding protein